MDSIAVLLYRIVEKEFIDDREAAAKSLVVSVREALTACPLAALKLIRSTVTDASGKQSEQTSYRLFLALEGVYSLEDPHYLERKGNLEKALQSAPDVQKGCIGVELEEEGGFSLEEYAERFGSFEELDY